MTSILGQNPSDLLDHYADVIEGGNAYASGDAQHGIPGTASRNELASTTITAVSGSESVMVASGLTLAQASKLVRADAPPFFLRCLTQDSGSGNVGAARKIQSVALDPAGAEYTFATAFPETIGADDTFAIEEGFRRTPDKVDPDKTESTKAYDRYFRLRLIPGPELDMSGNNTKIYDGFLEVALRLVRFGRDRAEVDRATNIISRLVAVLVRGDLRDGTYVQSLSARESEPEEEDSEDAAHITIVTRLRCIYRVQAAYL